MKNSYRLPLLINGRLKTPDEGAEEIELDYEGGARLVLPTLTSGDIREILATPLDLLVGLSVDDLTLFLKEVGKRWLDEKYTLRKQALEIGRLTTGYGAGILNRDWDYVARILADRNHMYDMIDAELGNRFSIDEWTQVQASYVRAFPRGRALHIMVGNAPIAAIITLIRSVLTKNITVAKLPARDIVTGLFFGLSFHDIDPNHPVTRSLSLAYWPRGSELEQMFIDNADLICVWGGGGAIEGIKRRAGYATEVLAFGPKRSLQLIGRDVTDVDAVAKRVAYDVSIYNQEACFCPQIIFVEGDTTEFAQALSKWNEYYMTVFDRGNFTVDLSAQVNLNRLTELFRGGKVIAPDHTGWTIVECEPHLPRDHPLSRTLYVFSVESLEEALPFIDKDVQTVGIAPWKRSLPLADEITRRGAARITEVGLVSLPRPGFTHDGDFPMRRMVRWVSNERSLEYKYKYVESMEALDEQLFANGWFGWTHPRAATFENEKEKE